tara:strand:+ start:553 stop:879 length:327 start_codon:yes stop_codon:yes gene_type:complete
MGRHMLEKNAVKIKNKIRDMYEEIAINILKPAAMNVTPINIILLSILSEINPIGHCDNAPKEVTIIINIDTSKTLRPLAVAYTAPYPKTALCDIPVRKAPINPNGDNA